MKVPTVYLGPGYVPEEFGKGIPLGSLAELHTCPTCGNEYSSRGNKLSYEAGRKFGNWVRIYVTGRFHDGLLAELTNPRGDDTEEDPWS